MIRYLGSTDFDFFQAIKLDNGVKEFQNAMDARLKDIQPGENGGVLKGPWTIGSGRGGLGLDDSTLELVAEFENRAQLFSGLIGFRLEDVLGVEEDRCLRGVREGRARERRGGGSRRRRVREVGEQVGG